MGRYKMINTVTRLINSNGGATTECKLEGDIKLLSRELAAICTAIHNLAIKQGKEAEFMEAFDKQYQAMQKAQIVSSSK